MSRLKKIAVLVVLVLLFQEVVFRIAFPIPELSNFDRSLFVLKEGQAGQYVRNRSFEWWSLPDTSAPSKVDYNMYGYRDNEWHVVKTKGRKRLMFVGDSFVEGIMAPEDKTIPAWFKAAGGNNLDVMNGGMLGIGIEEYLQFIADAVPIFRPNVVFLVIYANDFTSKEIQIPAFNLSETYFDKSQPRILELLKQYREGKPIPFRIPMSSRKLLPNTEDPTFPFKEKIDKMYLHADTSLVEHMLKADFNPYKLNEIFRLEKGLRETADFLVPMDFFRYYSEKYDFEPVVVYIPSRNQVTDHYLEFEHKTSLKLNRNISFTDSVYNLNQVRLGESCERLGLTYYDFTQIVTEQESIGNHLYWNFDDHMRPKGYRLIAEKLYESWSSR